MRVGGKGKTLTFALRARHLSHAWAVLILGWSDARENTPVEGSSEPAPAPHERHRPPLSESALSSRGSRNVGRPWVVVG